MKYLRRIAERHLDDVLIVCGAWLIVYATWLLSPIGALYVGGAFLIAGGVLVGLAERGGGSGG